MQDSGHPVMVALGKYATTLVVAFVMGDTCTYQGVYPLALTHRILTRAPI
jgi:hypothetical protein